MSHSSSTAFGRARRARPLAIALASRLAPSRVRGAVSVRPRTRVSGRIEWEAAQRAWWPTCLAELRTSNGKCRGLLARDRETCLARLGVIVDTLFNDENHAIRDVVIG